MWAHIYERKDRADRKDMPIISSLVFMLVTSEEADLNMDKNPIQLFKMVIISNMHTILTLETVLKHYYKI